MYKWFLATRYLLTKLIAVFGIASVMLCVAMVLVVLSVMGGFLDTVRERAKGLNSQIVLEAGTLQGVPYYDEFGAYLHRHLPDVVDVVTPTIYTYSIFRVPATTWTRPARVMGIRLRDYIRVTSFGEGLHYDRFYPDSTTLAEQSMPVAGISASGALILPDDLEKAAKQWRTRAADEEQTARFDASPFVETPFPYVVRKIPGDRVFAADTGPPRYAGPPHAGVIVGVDLLFSRSKDGTFQRYLARGADVALTLMPISPDGNLLGETPTRLPLRYVDDSRTGIFEIDNQAVYVDFDMLQHRLAMDPQPLASGGLTRARANQVLISLKEGAELGEAKQLITSAWLQFVGSLELDPTHRDARSLDLAAVYTWEDMQASFIHAIEKEKVLVTFLFAMISMVAIVLVGCIFYMIVEKKTRDIGILKSLGASSKGVAGLFIIYAGVVGLVGSTLGILFGSVVVWYINDIQDLLAAIHPQLRMWSPDVYSFDQIPNVVKRADAIWVGATAVLASILGSVIPARIAGRVWPVEALRYE